MNIEFKNGDKLLKIEFEEHKFIGIRQSNSMMFVELTNEQIEALSFALANWIRMGR